jgi:hypothetical protein
LGNFNHNYQFTLNDQINKEDRFIYEKIQSYELIPHSLNVLNRSYSPYSECPSSCTAVSENGTIVWLFSSILLLVYFINIIDFINSLYYIYSINIIDFINK